MKNSRKLVFAILTLVLFIPISIVGIKYIIFHQKDGDFNSLKQPVNGYKTVTRDAFQRIQTEHFEESEGVIVEESSEDKGQSIGGIKDGHYTAYYNIDFGEEGANRVVFRAAAMMKGGNIEIRLNGLQGELIGTCEIPNTGPDWNTWVNIGCDILPTTGIHNVYLVYKGEEYLFNLNWFRFAKGEGKVVERVKLNINAPKAGDQLVATLSPANAIAGYEWLVGDEVVSIAERYTVLPRDVGKTIKVRIKGLGYSKGTLVSEATREIVSADYEFNAEEAAFESFTGFIDTFYYYSNMNEFGLFLNTEFWDQAEIYEIVIDAYENTGHPRYKKMIYDIFKGFNLHNGKDWSHNEFNDDIMWMVIACLRAYFLTGDSMFLETAQYHFDLVWDRGWSDDLGGGIWWKTDNQTKNACINAPAAIAACLLGEALGDESYYTKAVQLVDWLVEHLYDSSTGQVYDAYDINGLKNHWASTYNQGTFIGANMLLYEHYKDETYFNRARLVSDYTIHTMYNGGVMSNEDSSGDLIGFKGILCRWISRFAIKNNQPDIMEWLKYNGSTAWSNRNQKGLIWTTWNSKTSDTAQYDIFGLSSAVSLLNNSRTNTNLVRDAQVKIESEAFDSCKGIITKECLEGGWSVEGIADGYYTVYHNVDFGEGGLKVAIFRAAAPKNGGTIEIRLGGINGDILGICEISSTGGWEVWKTFTCEITDIKGMQDLYLVYKGEGSLFSLNWFQFAP